jgi:glycosyltransferase involved in cell wall biosynthesis
MRPVSIPHLAATPTELSRRRRLRVLTLLDTLRPGGAERLAVTVAARLDRSRFEPMVCVSRSEPWSPLKQILEEANVPVVTLNRPHRGSVWSWAPLVGTVRRRRIDVLHAHMFGSNFWGTLVGRLAAVPVVIAHEHGSPLASGRLRQALDREIIARGADIVVAVSETERQRIVELEGIPREKVRLIQNGIPPLAAPDHDLRGELDIPESAPVIGTLTVLRPEKGLDFLIEATALLRADFPELRVLVAGTGSEEQRLARLIAERGLERTVLLLGFRPSVADVLAALDVAVHASVREGSPLAVLESMAAGKAIVATRVGGVPAQVRDGEHALLVPPHDAVNLASAVGRLLRDERLRARLGEKARRRQREQFDIRATVTALEELYEQLFAVSARGRREARVPPTSTISRRCRSEARGPHRDPGGARRSRAGRRR